MSSTRIKTSSGGWPSTRISLIERLQQQDAPRDWQTFVEVYQPLLLRFCRKRGLQDADAQDATQNVLLQVRRSLGKFQYDTVRGQLRSWLGTLAVRGIWKVRERQRKAGIARGEGELSAVDPAENDAVWIVEFNSHVYATAMSRVRETVAGESWDVFEAVWVNEEPPREVAARTGLALNRVYKLKFKVLQELKRQVEFLTADIAGLCS